MSDEERKYAEEDGAEADLGRILRTAGRRVDPPQSIEREVRAAVRSEWQAVVAERHRDRRRWMGIAAAAVTLITAGLWLTVTVFNPGAGSVASVARVVGTLEADGGLFSPARRLSAGEPIRVGDKVRTTAAGGASLQLSNGIGVRLDAATDVKFVGNDRLEVKAGAAYVDTKQDNARAVAALVLATPFGAVRHLGTRYEVRVAARQLQVTVREGRVVFTGNNGDTQTGAAGERLTVDPAGRIGRTRVASDAAEWNWANALAAPFAIENRSLAEFLEWVGRELGRDIVYATPQDEQEARQVILRGSIGALAPRESLMAVLSTTRLHGRETDGRIVIESN